MSAATETIRYQIDTLHPLDRERVESDVLDDISTAALLREIRERYLYCDDDDAIAAFCAEIVAAEEERAAAAERDSAT